MPIVSLEPKTKQKIEAELNASIPLPDEEAFEGFAEGLRLSHPDLHRELILGLKVDSKMPIEQEALKAKRRHRLRAVVNKWFYKTRWPSDRVLDKRRVLFTVLLLLMGALPGFYWLRTLGTDTLSKAPVTPDDTMLRTKQDQSDNFFPSYSLNQPLFSESMTEPENTEQPSEVAQIAIPLPPPKPAPTPLPQTYTPFPKAVSPQIVNVPEPPKPPAIPETNIPEPEIDAINVPNLPKTLAVKQAESGARALEVWALPKEIPAQSLTSTQDLPKSDSFPLLAFSGSQEDSSSLTVSTIERFQPTDDALRVMQSEESVKEPGTVFTLEQEGQPLSVLTEPTDSSPLTVFSQPQGLEALSITIQSSNSQGLEVNQTSQSASSSEKLDSVASLLTVGTRLSAVLKAGLALSEDISMPVIAETTGNWCGETTCAKLTWLGQAELQNNGRVDLSFSELVIEDEVLPITAVALGQDDALGLAISTEILASEVAQTVLQSAAGGVSDYLNALINQQKITLKDNALIQEDQVPGIEAFLLNRLAQLIAAPSLESEDTRVARLDKETEFTLLIRD
ncbi:MAG: hypothetical protein KC422_19980 [Trueperaceae bacterium]|nr:hypothetical protein [Trueperaceae bacterium]